MSEFNFYQITAGFPSLMENEEITEEDKKKIEDELKILLQKKSKSIIGYTKNIELTINAMKEEEKRMANDRKALENKLNRFKEYVKECMENNDIKKIQTDLGALSIARSKASVEVTNEEIIPAEYKQEIKTVNINKNKILSNFTETGEVPDGVIIHTDNTYLKIK